MSHQLHEKAEIHFGMGQKTLATYLTGFFLCIVLTLIPFWLVIQHVLPNKHLYLALFVFAVIQLYVQVVFFLRVNASPEGRWNLGSFLFTLLILAIVVIGALWIMYNLNFYMAH